MFTCKKIYRDIPIAHRQSAHTGHCTYFHGHNLCITFEFGCHELDSSGFVLDLGSLKYLYEWIQDNFDHACLFNEDDPIKDDLLKSYPSAFKAYTLKSCSCEGIAQHLYETFSSVIKEKYNQRVFIKSITVQETEKNLATYRP